MLALHALVVGLMFGLMIAKTASGFDSSLSIVLATIVFMCTHCLAIAANCSVAFNLPHFKVVSYLESTCLATAQVACVVKNMILICSELFENLSTGFIRCFSCCIAYWPQTNRLLAKYPFCNYVA